MSHSRFELGFPRHRKLHRLSDAAFRLWASAIDYAREQRTNGHLDEDDLSAIPRGARLGTWKASHAAELEAAGLWERADDGWLIHDFLDWQDSDEEANAKRERARERMRKVRANRKRTSREVALTTLTPPSNSDPLPALGDGSTCQVRSPDQLAEAARQILRDPFSGSFERPSIWPEVQEIAAAWSFGAPVYLSDSAQRDSGLKAILEAIGAGIPVPDLVRAGVRAVSDPWFSDPKRRDPSSFTLSVVRRLLDAPRQLAPVSDAEPADIRARREAGLL